MSLRSITPCDFGECPYNAEYMRDCESWCGEDEHLYNIIATPEGEFDYNEELYGPERKEEDLSEEDIKAFINFIMKNKER